MNDLTLVIPAKEEADSLPIILKEIEELGLKCKVKVCLSSNDTETINSLKDFPDIEIFRQSGIGYGNALIEGINAVNTKFFCIFNADGSFNPKEIESIYQNLQKQDSAKFIFASRYLPDASTKDDTIVTSFGNFVFSMIGKIFFSLPISDILYTFVMGNTKSFKKINFIKQDFRFCVELPIKLHRSGFKIIDEISHERPRIAGKKKPNALKDGFLILIELIRLFFIKK